MNGYNDSVQDIERKSKRILNEALEHNLNPRRGLTARQVIALQKNEAVDPNSIGPKCMNLYVYM